MESNRKILEFPPICTIVEGHVIHARLLAALADTQGAVLGMDLSDVESADVTLIQLLLAAETSALARRKRLSVDASPSVAELLARAGLADWLNATAS